MKNKKALQKEAREKHRKFLRKNRKDEPELDRNKPSKYEKPTILIVCEGKNTEPSYFRQFKLTTAEVKPIGEGYNTVTLVNRAIELSQKGYDQVWCVFDKDDFPNTDFNNAIQIAKAQNFGVAYSNQAFEYWILLHFDDHQGGGMHRNQYDEKINNHLKNFGLSYDGQNSKVITEEIFDLLESIDEKFEKDRKTLAIERAKRIYNRLNKISPAKEESSTTVFKLVEELNKYI